MTLNYGQFVEDPKVQRGFVPSIGQDLEPGPSGPYRFVFKRMLDLTLVLLAAPFIVPIIAILALIVAREGGRPFYTQERLGLNGRVFRMWKLRTMVVDADARLQEHLAKDPAAREEWEVTQKLLNDPRITRIGAFLRKSSLDELPQLWNVMTGDMSLVGPRPMMIHQREMYPSAAYFRMRPGITGYWQTAGRHRTSFAARASFDAAYEKDISFATDVTLLFRTVGVVMKGTGC